MLRGEKNLVFTRRRKGDMVNESPPPFGVRPPFGERWAVGWVGWWCGVGGRSREVVFFGGFVKIPQTVGAENANPSLISRCRCSLSAFVVKMRVCSDVEDVY